MLPRDRNSVIWNLAQALAAVSNHKRGAGIKAQIRDACVPIRTSAVRLEPTVISAGGCCPSG